MNEHMPQLGALQVDRDPEDGIFAFLKKPSESYAAGKLWRDKNYENETLQEIAHNSIWTPATTGKLPACDFIPRMQALLPNVPSTLRDNILAQLDNDPSQYVSILSCAKLSKTPCFRPHFGNGIVVILKNEEDFRTFTNSDCILSDYCGRRAVPFVSKKEVFVPRMQNNNKNCPTCGAPHRISDCLIHKQFLLCKTAVIQRVMITHYKLSTHIFAYLDPLPEEVILPEEAGPSSVDDNQRHHFPPNKELKTPDSDPKKRNKPSSKPLLKQASMTSYLNKGTALHYAYEHPDSYPSNHRAKDHESSSVPIRYQDFPHPLLCYLIALFFIQLVNLLASNNELSMLAGGGRHGPDIRAISDVPTEISLTGKDKVLKFVLHHTAPDGNCFYHSLTHAQSSVARLFQVSPSEIRSKC
jgi:hypothetical protein